jgi:hypothetical protein
MEDEDKNSGKDRIRNMGQKREDGNVKHYKQLLLDTVYFEREAGYSGRTWIGYFERKTAYSLEIAQKIISLFFEFFENDLNDFVVVTSCYIDKDNLVETENIEIENELCKKGYIKSINGNQYFDKDQQVWEEQISNLELSFQVFHSDKDIITKFSLLGMTDTNVQGYCYFISEKLDLIIYPHGDNTGYGCIGIKSKNNEKGIEFLKTASKNGFNSYIEYNGEIKKIEN